MTLFPEWQAEQLVHETLPQRLLAMFRRYGRGDPDRKCKACKHLVGWSYARTYYKCELFGLTHGAATDWRLSYPSCGKFEEGQG